jgi:hypothetical protein
MYFLKKNWLPCRFYTRKENPKIFSSAADAIRDIPSGATLLVGGFFFAF